MFSLSAKQYDSDLILSIMGECFFDSNMFIACDIHRYKCDLVCTMGFSLYNWLFWIFSYVF